MNRFWLLVAACLLAGRVQACRLPGNAVTVQEGRVVLAGRALVAVTQALPNDQDPQSRLLVLDAACGVAWSAVVEGMLSHFDVRRLGGTRVLQFVTMQAYGDGTGYVHRLLAERAGRLALLIPPVRHFGKDGFYLGRLAGGQSEGVVTWTADPTGESEAAAHPFVVRTWRWSGGALRGPAQYETARAYAAPDDAPSRPDFAAEAMGLPYHDQTGSLATRFQDWARVDTQMEDLAFRQQPVVK